MLEIMIAILLGLAVSGQPAIKSSSTTATTQDVPPVGPPTGGENGQTPPR